jgi:hypothetical protein
MINRAGTYEGVAIPRFAIGTTEGSGNKQVGFVAEVTSGPFAGEQAPWRITIRQSDPKERAEDIDRLVEVLRACGWTGTKLSELLAGKHDGFGMTPVRLVFQNEYFDAENKRTVKEDSIDPETLDRCIEDGSIKVQVRLRFINKPMEATMKNPIDGAELDAFAGDVDEYIAQVGSSAGRARFEKQAQKAAPKNGAARI